MDRKKQINLTTYFYREALSIRIKAGLLTCTISDILPIPQSGTVDLNGRKRWRAYSCATVHDSHVVPYYPLFGGTLPVEEMIKRTFAWQR